MCVSGGPGPRALGVNSAVASAFRREAEGKPTCKPCSCPCDKGWAGTRSPEDECAFRDSQGLASTCSGEKVKHLLNELCQEYSEVGMFFSFSCS